MLTNPMQFIPSILSALWVGFLPHILRLPWVISVWCFMFWGYLYIATKKKLPRPNTKLLLGIFVVALLIVLFSSGRTIAGHTYIALLAAMAALKPYEIKTRRDCVTTLLISYFLIVAALFESESLFMTLYMFPAVIYNTSILIRIHHPSSPITTNLKLTTQMMLQALPLMIVLFFLFPRIENGFWQGNFGGRNTTGFKDRFTIGAMSNLVRNDAVAFRAIFKGPIPGRSLLYWRGIVFWLFDGKTWIKGARRGPRHQMVSGQTTFDYTISLLPHSQRWMFALDLPLSAKGNCVILSDNTLLSRQRINRTLRYQVKSVSDYHVPPELDPPRAAFQLPRGGNHQTRALARKWKTEIDSPSKIIETALSFFSNPSFVYTLNPPKLSNTNIDNFLFETRKGYCEHYAAAFAFLMRAAGVPARLVGGYLGGEYNPIGKYFTVRQSDAHVWVEVWLENQGWVRVDPTAVVAPTRIEGLAQSLSPEDLPDFLKKDRFGRFSNLYNRIRLSLDTLNILWDIWFSGFSRDDQLAVLMKIGIHSLNWLIQTAALFVGLGFAFVIVVYYIFRANRSQPEQRDGVQKYYLLFCRKLRRIGIPRAPSMGPMDFGNKIIALRKDLEPQVREIIELYSRLRYKQDDQAVRKLFFTKVRHFKPSGSTCPKFR